MIAIKQNWTRKEIDVIWEDYAEHKMDKIVDLKYVEKFSKTEAFCPYCQTLILKAQYQGWKPDEEYSWTVDYIDGNTDNKNLDNLQPMHPWCIADKYDLDYEYAI